MKTALLNLPFEKRVMRRWVASYYAPNFLIPPIELMSLGAIIKEWKKAPVHLIDAVAEVWSIERVIAELRRIQPDILVTMPGFNTFPRDMEALSRIAGSLPGTRIVCFGYLPTQFPREVLERTKAEIVIRNEPELAFSDLYECLERGDDLSQVDGIAFRRNGAVHVNRERGRIEDLDGLPFPDHGLIKLDRYRESYLDRPIGVIMSERGCPFRCTYCVKTYGSRLISRSAESILNEIQQLRERHGIRSIRFLDDTFSTHREGLVRICEGLCERQLEVGWTCLTRLDVLDRELLALMKRSGCRRMYVGIESGSEKMLDYYQKGQTPGEIREQMAIVSESGIEVSAFFIVGAPVETDQDIEESIQLAVDLDLDYVIVTKLQFWPGTELFEREKPRLGFDLFANGETLYSLPGYQKACLWQKRFYRRFYFRRRYIAKRLKTLLRSPRDLMVGLVKLIWYLIGRNTRDDFI